MLVVDVCILCVVLIYLKFEQLYVKLIVFPLLEYRHAYGHMQRMPSSAVTFHIYRVLLVLEALLRDRKSVV